ncbi:MAG: hypothetical protein KAJ57_03575 [Woeseiaceae bacterium]|nr:hypothetical protein [Woeseiaceae bacterium]
MNRKQITIAVAVVVTLLIIVTFPVLRDEVAGLQHQRELSRGMELAAAYCSACHLEPMPEMLPKKGWEMVLGYM